MREGKNNEEEEGEERLDFLRVMHEAQIQNNMAMDFPTMF